MYITMSVVVASYAAITFIACGNHFMGGVTAPPGEPELRIRLPGGKRLPIIRNLSFVPSSNNVFCRYATDGGKDRFLVWSRKDNREITSWTADAADSSNAHGPSCALKSDAVYFIANKTLYKAFIKNGQPAPTKLDPQGIQEGAFMRALWSDGSDDLRVLIEKQDGQLEICMYNTIAEKVTSSLFSLNTIKGRFPIASSLNMDGSMHAFSYSKDITGSAPVLSISGLVKGKSLSGEFYFDKDRSVAASIIAFSPNSKSLILGGKDGSVRIYQAMDMSRSPILMKGPQYEISAVSVAKDSKFVMFSSFDRKGKPNVFISSMAGVIHTTFSADPNGVLSAALSPDGSDIAVIGADGDIKVWPTAGLLP